MARRDVAAKGSCTRGRSQSVTVGIKREPDCHPPTVTEDKRPLSTRSHTVMFLLLIKNKDKENTAGGKRKKNLRKR